jgi:hypothetical protein
MPPREKPITERIEPPRMNERRIVVASLAAAVALAGATTLATGQPTALAQTPLGVAIYAFVGVAVPQHVIAMQNGSEVRLGFAGIAGMGALAAVMAGYARGGVNEPWSVGFASLLMAVVFGSIIGSVVREFRAGYRAGTAEGSR